MRDQILALVFKHSWGARRAVKLADSYVQLTEAVDVDSASEDNDASPADIDEAENGVVQEALCSQVRQLRSEFCTCVANAFA